MSFLIRWFMLVALGLGAGGCLPSSEGQADEQKDPYFQTGKSRAMDRDFKGAIESFEKALEANPRSALAHFELGLLYEQQENDYAAALYHYDRCFKLRPDEHPADNARGRIEICKRELAKSVAQAPSMDKIQQLLDKLTVENQQLRQTLEQLQPAGARVPGPTSPVVIVRPGNSSLTNPPNRNPLPLSNHPGHGGITPLPPAARTHKVAPGETLAAIARRHSVKLTALQAANPGLNPLRLRPGQSINLPP